MGNSHTREALEFNFMLVIEKEKYLLSKVASEMQRGDLNEKPLPVGVVFISVPVTATSPCPLEIRYLPGGPAPHPHSIISYYHGD